jgi:hypothetical protein
MRRLLYLTSALLIAANSYAVAPQFWRVGAAEDFLAGELEGFAVTSRGELRVAPAMKKIATFTDPFVLSQAAAPNGDRFFGTGNDGKIYRLRGEKLEVLATASEPEIYALAFVNGSLLAGTSPNGKIYRVDPNSGAQTVFYDPQQAYIWAIAKADDKAGNDVLVATGVEGKLFRVTADGKGSVLYDSTDTHIRSIGVRKDGSILAGASGKGRIYQVGRDGGAIALFESPLNEISSIYVDANGTGWASGVSNVLPASAPAKPAQAKPAAQGQAQQQQQGAAAEGQQQQQAAGTVEVAFSFDDSAATAAAQAGASEVYRIDPDGFVDTVRKFDREMVYAVSGGNDATVLLATGPNGRVYELRGGEVALIGAVPEKQIVSISGSGSNTLITTTNSGAVYRMENGSATAPEFRSAAKDVDRFSRFGNYRVEGRNLTSGNVAISFRSGNTRTPDATWSGWSSPQNALEGNVTSPSARYVQWRLTMPKPSVDASIDSVTVAYMNRNIAPEIEAFGVQEPAVVYITNAYPAAPQVVEATNPDEYGIFSSLESARDRTPAEQGKRMFRKGFRTLSWRASDDNGDSLRYSLSFRMKGSGQWLRLRDKVEETQLNFDTSQLPDGLYELRLTASDETENPDTPLTDEREGVEFLVDNTAPQINVASAGNAVTVRITDTASPIGRVEYSADAEKWVRITPVDGIADSREETFRLDANAVNGKFVIVRAVDGQYNVTTQNVNVR